MASAKAITCYGQYHSQGATQEWYETASRDAGRRTRELRKAGFRCVSEGMGSQVTPVGRVAMTLVHVWRDDAADLPPVNVVRL